MLDSEDSDQTGRMPIVFAGAQPFCWFCHVKAQFLFSILFTEMLMGMNDSVLR